MRPGARGAGGAKPEGWVADLLGKIERLLEDAVEGTSRRLFRARVEPVQIAKAAARALEEQQVIGPDGPEVPNDYRIALHPTDFAQFEQYRQSLQTKIQRYLEQFAGDRGLRPVADWRVDLAADEGVPRRTIHVDARMADPTIARPMTAEEHAAIEGTAPLRPADEIAVRPRAILIAEDGRRFPLTAEVTTVGRALDNDIVIADSRVSRYHARIERAGTAWALRDVGSTNGTAVSGRRVTEQGLADRSELSLGGFKLVLHLGKG